LLFLLVRRHTSLVHNNIDPLYIRNRS